MLDTSSSSYNFHRFTGVTVWVVIARPDAVLCFYATQTASFLSTIVNVEATERAESTVETSNYCNENSKTPGGQTDVGEVTQHTSDGKVTLVRFSSS